MKGETSDTTTLEWQNTPRAAHLQCVVIVDMRSVMMSPLAIILHYQANVQDDDNVAISSRFR